MPTHGQPRAAVCVAGAWRAWDRTWEWLEKHVVLPLDADVFVVTDATDSGTQASQQTPRMLGSDADFNPNERSSLFHEASVDLRELNASMRGRLRAGLLIHPRDPVSPVIAEAMPMYPISAYLRKIWECGQLMHKSRVAYDVVVRTRPDILFMQPMFITHVPPPGPSDTGAAKRSTPQPPRVLPRFLLTVDRTRVEFSEREVVIPSFGAFCANDWLAIGTMASMTVTMDLARFTGPRVAWFSPSRAARGYIDWSKQCYGSEAQHDMLWRRTGTVVHRWPLWAEVVREWRQEAVQPLARSATARASNASAAAGAAGNASAGNASAGNASAGNAAMGRARLCIGAIGCHVVVNNYTRALPIPGKAYGRVFHFDRSEECAGGVVDHEACATLAGSEHADCAGVEWLAKRVDGKSLCAEAMQPPAPSHLAEAEWWYPDCADIEDLTAPWPLPPCKFRTPSAAEHPVRVLIGYGAPFVPDALAIERLRRNTSQMLRGLRTLTGWQPPDLRRIIASRGFKASREEEAFHSPDARLATLRRNASHAREWLASLPVREDDH